MNERQLLIIALRAQATRMAALWGCSEADVYEWTIRELLMSLAHDANPIAATETEQGNTDAALDALAREAGIG